MELSALDVARSYVGVHEGAGNLENPLIQGWLSLCHIEDPVDAIAWCSAFCVGVLYNFKALGVPSSRSAAARSWLRIGEAVSLVDAKPGWDIVVLQRGAGVQPGPEVIAAPGHVGFYAGRPLSANLPSAAPGLGQFLLLAGNQGDAVTVAVFPEARILGIRRLYSE